jgi:epoxyqueuosine reductase QueG
VNKIITPNDLRNSVEDYVTAYSKTIGGKNIWRQPLLATAKADDRFDVLPRIVAEDHALPQDLLPSAKSVVVFFVPFTKALAVENHKGESPCENHKGESPCRNWGLAYESTNRLINSLCEHLGFYFDGKGYKARLTPATHNFDPVRLVSRWSHKHLGYIAGLGRFGVNAQFITPSGCAGRLGSLVTDADLGDSPLVEKKELCLYKNGRECLVCVKRCPVDAVSEEGINRKLCWERLNFNIRHTEELAGLEKTTHVCGKCQVLVPCSLRIPKGK